MNYRLVDGLCKLYNIKHIKGSAVPVLDGYKFVDRLNSNSCYISSKTQKYIDIEVADSLAGHRGHGIYLSFSKTITRLSNPIASIPAGAYGNKNDMYLLGYVNGVTNLRKDMLEDILNSYSKKKISVCANQIDPVTVAKREGPTVVYTDASISKRRGGIGVWIENTQQHYRFRVHERDDINMAELLAILCGLLLAGEGDIVIVTDSLISIKLIRGEMYNKKYSLLVDCIWRMMDEKNRCVSIKKVASHTGVEGNEIADYLARSSITGMHAFASEVLFYPGVGYVEELGLVAGNDPKEDLWY